MYKMKKRQQAIEYMILIGMAISVLVVTYMLSEFIFLFSLNHIFYDISYQFKYCQSISLLIFR